MQARRLNAVLIAALVLPLPATTGAFAADQPGAASRIELAQAPPVEDPIAKKKREEEQKRKQQAPPPPPAPRPQPQIQRPTPPPPRPQPNVTPPPPRPVPRRVEPAPPPPPPKPQPSIVRPPVPESPRRPAQAAPVPTPVQPQQPSILKPKTTEGAPVSPPAAGAAPAVPKRKATEGMPAAGAAPAAPSILKPRATEGTPVPPPTAGATPATPSIQQRAPEGQRPLRSGRGTGQPAPASAAVPALAPQKLEVSPKAAAPAPRFDQVQQQRKTTVEAGGNRTVIQEGNNRTIIKQDNRVFIRHDDADRFKRLRNARSIPLTGGGSQTFYVRPDGFRVVTETDRNGGLIRRFRRGPDGREFNIIDNRRFWRNAAIGVGVGVIGAAIILNLRSPVVSIPREHYIVDYGRVSDDDLYVALNAPPIEPLERAYSLEEVRYNYPLRERMRSVDLDDINFETGAFEVTPDQHGKLERLARIINRVLGNNTDEVFLIEGHTDAVGDQVDNMSLSDRRAQSVAQILSEEFGVPPENLVTQGYGEQHLKVDTRGPERANRRVTVRRVTPLIAEK
jgi:outer membrane protein OmpA-like peptidoglycan-associated protein